MNPILGLLGMGGNQNLMFRAVRAMMSGQSAESFMQELAQTDKRFADVDLSNLEQSARSLCRQKGVDEKQLTAQIKDNIQGML